MLFMLEKLLKKMWFNRVLVNGAISSGQWQDIHLKKTLEWAVQPPAVTFPHNELIVCVNYDPGGRWVTSAHWLVASLWPVTKKKKKLHWWLTCGLVS